MIFRRVVLLCCFDFFGALCLKESFFNGMDLFKYPQAKTINGRES